MQNKHLLKNDAKEFEPIRKENMAMETGVKKAKQEKEISDEKNKKEIKELEVKLLKAESLKNERECEIVQLKDAINQINHEELNRNVKKEEEFKHLMEENEYLVNINSEKQQLLVKLTEDNETMDFYF